MARRRVRLWRQKSKRVKEGKKIVGRSSSEFVVCVLLLRPDNMEPSSSNETDLKRGNQSLEGKEEKDCEPRHVRKKIKLLGKEDTHEIEGGGQEVACVSSSDVQSISSEDSETSTKLLLEKFYKMSRSSKDQNVPNQPIPLDLPDPSEGFLAQCFPGKTWPDSIGPL